MLKQIAERTGGRLLTGAETDLFHPQRTPRESTPPVFDWFLLALACLVPLDVARAARATRLGGDPRLVPSP